MATFNLAVNFPDAQQARVLAALKTYWTTKDAQGVDVVPSTAQVIEKLRLVVAANLTDIVHRVERDAAIAQAAASVTPIAAS